MKAYLITTAVVVCVAVHASAQPVEIVSFDGNGRLPWPSPSGSVSTIEWASRLTGGTHWQSTWADLRAIHSTNSLTTADVPMFYRVTSGTNGLFADIRLGRTYSFSASNAVGQTWTQEWTCAGLLTVPSVSETYVLLDIRDIPQDLIPLGSMGNRHLLWRTTDESVQSYEAVGWEATECQVGFPFENWTNPLPDGAIQENTIWTNQSVTVGAGTFSDCIGVYREEMIHPSDRIAHGLAFSGVDDRAVLFAGWGPTSDTWEYDSTSGRWRHVNLAGNAPPPRQWHGMAFGGGSTVVVFGGDTGHYPDRHLVDDTWEYDTSTHTWTAISPAGAKPSARSEHAMAYAGGSKVIMFGGADAEWNHLSDTWEYDTTTHAWTPISLSGTNPPARFAHAMAYAGGSTVVLFGGNHDGTILSDTWEYHVVNQTWTNVTGGATPPFRWQHAMSDAGNSTVLMFGGIEEYDPPTRINRDDTWIYDATAHTWTEYNTSGVKPAARHLHRMAWLGGNRVLLFAGEATLGPGLDDWDQVSDTWQYDMAAHSWAQKVTATPCAHPRQKWVEWWKPGFFMVKWTDLEMHDTNACPVTYELKSWRDD